MSPFLEGPCQQSTGFLFAHDCGLPAGAECMKCGKRVCDKHLTSAGTELLCPTCAEEADASDETEAHSDGDADFDSAEDDPSYYYKNYGYYGPGSSWARERHDPDDFTEADGESLRHEEAASFEEDLGGS